MAVQFKSIIQNSKELPVDIPIDFKRINGDRLSWAQSFEKILIQADEDGHTRDNFISHLKGSEEDGVLRNTTIINFGTGQGKSSACLRLAKYYTDKDYVVFFVNPFKRLVDKYVEGFERHKQHDENFSFFNYQNLEKKDYDFKDDLDCNAYLMSMNFLFQDPGNEHSEQAYGKQQFLLKLFDRLRKKKKKVILFIDEFHANITNFDSYYSVNLIKWYDIIEKNFIVSATFTEEALSLTQKIAVLTDYHVKVYESERTKMSAQADLYINMVQGYYSSTNTEALNSILNLARHKKKEGKTLNFIFAYKSLTNQFFKKGKTALTKALQDEFPEMNVVTSESNSEYLEGRDNAGTAFNTGIDINDPNSVLIILLPPDKKSKGGIFSSGYLSIVQTIGRLRQGGEIFIYGRAPEVLIGGKYLNYLKEGFKKDLKMVKNINQKEQLVTLRNYYLAKRKSSYSFNNEIEELNKKAEKSEYYLPNTFPTFSEFIIKYGEKYLTTKFEVFGKGYMPYVLWAACNNQFNNATLKDIYILSPDKVICNLDSDYLYHTLEYYYTPVEIKQIVGSMDNYKAHICLLKLLIQRIDSADNLEKKVTIFLDREILKSSSLTQHVGVNRAIHSLIETYRTGHKIYYDNAYLYFAKFFEYSKSKYEAEEKLGTLIAAYLNLYEIIIQVKTAYPSVLNMEIAVNETKLNKKQVVEIILDLLNYDYFLRNKIFTLLRKNDLKKNNKEFYQKFFKWVVTNFSISSYDKNSKSYDISEWKPIIYQKGKHDALPTLDEDIILDEEII